MQKLKNSVKLRVFSVKLFVTNRSAQMTEIQKRYIEFFSKSYAMKKMCKFDRNLK